MPPTLSRDALRGLIASAMRRGVPRADAEDIVLRAYEKGVASYDPAKGRLEPLLQRVVERDSVEWWRHARRWRGVQEQLSEVVALRPTPEEARRNAADKQRLLLAALDAEERRVFAAWALQKHLPQGEFTADRAARTLQMTVPEFNNAKRRLRARVQQVLSDLDLDPHELWSVGDDEGPRRKRHA